MLFFNSFSFCGYIHLSFLYSCQFLEIHMLHLKSLPDSSYWLNWPYCNALILPMSNSVNHVNLIYWIAVVIEIKRVYLSDINVLFILVCPSYDCPEA